MNLLIKSEWNEKQNKQKQLYIPRKTLLFLNQTNKCIPLFMCNVYTKSGNDLTPFDFNTSGVKVTQF